MRLTRTLRFILITLMMLTLVGLFALFQTTSDKQVESTEVTGPTKASGPTEASEPTEVTENSENTQSPALTALVVGDSISAAYGLPEKDGWVALAEQQLQSEGYDVDFVNASISGDTTVGGLRRLPDALKRFSPDVLIIELGGNDGLRGYSTDAMQENIENMAELATQSGARVLILGMLIPSNYGTSYVEKFSQAFVDAATETDSDLVPFLLQPIAHNRDYFQDDGIHPTAEAQPLLVEHVMPLLLEILDGEQLP